MEMQVTSFDYGIDCPEREPENIGASEMGSKRRMEEGVVFRKLGYDVRNGKMYVNEEGAEVVRKIFYKFVEERKSTHTIARELLEEGIYPMRSKKWRNTVILRILQMKNIVGIWCRRRHLHRIIFLMRKNIIGVRRSL